MSGAEFVMYHARVHNASLNMMLRARGVAGSQMGERGGGRGSGWVTLQENDHPLEHHVVSDPAPLSITPLPFTLLAHTYIHRGFNPPGVGVTHCQCDVNKTPAFP